MGGLQIVKFCKWVESARGGFITNRANRLVDRLKLKYWEIAMAALRSSHQGIELLSFRHQNTRQNWGSVTF